MIRYAKIAGGVETTRNFDKQAKHLKRAIVFFFCLNQITKFGVGMAMRMIKAKWFLTL